MTTTACDARYWRGLSDDNLEMAGTFIRARQYGKAIDCLKAALRNANRAHDLRRSGRCCSAIRRLQNLIARLPVAPATPAWPESP